MPVMTSQDLEIKGLEIEQISVYLCNSGWKLLTHPNPHIYLFKGPIDDSGQPIQLVLPTSKELWDSSILLAKAINLLAAIEEASPYDVIEQIQSTYFKEALVPKL